MDEKEIKYYINRFIESTAEYAPRDDENLLEMGILDSMGVAELLAYIEKQFDVAINLEDITLENFSTINAISLLIESNIRG